MNKIVFVNRYFHPDHSATSQLLEDLARELVCRKRSVEVVTSRQLYEDAGAALARRECLDGIAVRRVATTRFGRRNLVGRVFDYITFYLVATFVLLTEVEAGDILVVKTDPPLFSILGYFVAWVKRARYVNWLQDIFPEVAVALGVKVRPRGLESLILWLRDITLRSAWRNVVLGDKMKAYVVSRGVSESRTLIVPNWSDGEIIFPVDRRNNALISEWRLDGKFVVGYSGNLGRAHEFETIIGAAKLLKDESNIVFLFIGGGAQIENVRARALQKGLGNVVFRPYQPKERLAESLSLPDIHVISLRPELEGLIVPSKFYGIAAAGRPSIFVGDQDGELPGLLRRYECGYAVSVGDVREFAAIVKRLYTNEEERARAGVNARKLFESCFDKPIALERWARILDSDNE